MKKQIVCIVILLAVISLLTGCQAPQPGQFEQLAQTVNDGTDLIIDALETSEAVAPDKLAALEVKIAVIQEASIAAAKEYDSKAMEDKIGAGIDAAIVANKLSTPINPYAVPISGGLTILSGIYALIKRKDAIKNEGEAAFIGDKYDAHKTGTEVFKLKHPTDAAELYGDIGKARAANKIT